jgi:hypothetical protein
MKLLYSIGLLIICLSVKGQFNCNFKIDSCALPLQKQKVQVELMEVPIKKDYYVQFIKNGEKNFLKIIVSDNLGFGNKGSLLLLLNKKQIYIKTIELKVINKTSGYFLLPLDNNNYLENIKDLGITKLIFCEKNECSIPKNDTEQIKKAANCFYIAVQENSKSADGKLQN